MSDYDLMDEDEKQDKYEELWTLVEIKHAYFSVILPRATAAAQKGLYEVRIPLETFGWDASHFCVHSWEPCFQDYLGEFLQGRRMGVYYDIDHNKKPQQLNTAHTMVVFWGTLNTFGYEDTGSQHY